MHLVLLSVALIAGASMALTALDPLQRPERAARLAAPDKAIGLYSQAIVRESAYAYHWADLGAAYFEAGDLVKARAAFARALELSGELPQIWLRDANFHFDLGEADEGLLSASRVLRKVPDYDGVLFSYFEQLGLQPDRVLDSLAGAPRPARAYAEFLIANQRVSTASGAWRRLSRDGYLTDALTCLFIDALLRNQRYEQAGKAWAAYLNDRRRDYPDKNLLFNGSFEQDPTGCALDWRISPSDPVVTAFDSGQFRSGLRSLRIQFPGTTNINYANLVQLIPVQSGIYRVSAWVRTEGITTNEGPRIEIYDAESPGRLFQATEPFVGTHSWTLSEQRFTVGNSTRLIAVRIARRPSAKFDHKIAGTLWVDDFTLNSLSR